MKTKITELNSLFLGSVLIVVTTAIGRAEPSPDLMNSITAMRLEAQKTSKASSGRANADRDCSKCLIWSRTQNITAGQGTVAVPDFAPKSGSRENDFQIAPLKNKASKRETK